MINSPSVEEQLAEARKISSESNDSEHKYYAISFPLGTICEEIPMGRPLVLENKLDALCIIKRYKGARFKEFTNKTDAIKFASEAVICVSPAGLDALQFSTAADNEQDLSKESSGLKSVTSQQIVKLRKAIERGDISSFKRTIWENPRYLITSGDFPTIMQEGSHYNAMHVAARYKREIFCELILNTIQDPAFFKLIYDDDTNEARMERIRHVTDLYLNTPDKALCETPLHFAAKFGCLQMVKTLLSHPLCDKTKTNKYGLSAEQMICERCPSCSDGLKQEIAEAFETLYYVPVLRQDGNLIPAIIGKPCLSHVIKSSSYSATTMHPFDIHHTSLSVKAYAGPMPLKVANAFYAIWKNPASPQPISYSPGDQKIVNEIRLSDIDKGLERLGRALAEDFGTKWVEYWPMLDAWLNLKSPEGLHSFESYLERKLQDRSIMEQKELNALVNSVSDHFHDLATELVSDDSLAENIVEKHFCVFDKLLRSFEEMYRILKTESLNSEFRLIHSNLADLFYAYLSLSMDIPSITRVKHRIRLCLCPSIGQTIEKIARPDVIIPLQHLLCVFKYFGDEDSFPKLSACKCIWKKEFSANPHLGAIFNNIISGHIKFCQIEEKKECSYGDSKEIFNSVEELDLPYLDELMGYPTTFVDADEVYSTPPETPYFRTPFRCLDNFEEINKYWSPVSKHDIDMFVALNCDVDPQRYPCVYKWKNFVRATLLKQTSKSISPLSLTAPKLCCRFPKASDVRKTLF